MQRRLPRRPVQTVRVQFRRQDRLRTTARIARLAWLEAIRPNRGVLTATRLGSIHADRDAVISVKIATLLVLFPRFLPFDGFRSFHNDSPLARIVAQPVNEFSNSTTVERARIEAGMFLSPHRSYMSYMS